METARATGQRSVTFLALLLAHLVALGAVSLAAVSGAQDGGAPAPAPAPAPAEGGAAAAAPPAIPDWTPADPALAAQYAEARQHLDARRYDEAKRLLRKIRTAAKGTAGEAAVERCLREADGGLLCEKAGELVAKGQHRRVAALWLEEGKELAGTFTGVELEKFHREAIEEIFETLADFEPKSAAAAGAPAGGTGEGGSGGGGEGGEGGGGEGGEGGSGGARGRGTTEYGANTRLVTGSPEGGEVRRGTGALYWMTTAQLGILQFEIPEGMRLEDYRYLRISLRAEEPDAEPPLLLIFDCEAGNFAGGPGGGPGGGGRRAGAWIVGAVHRRVGFHNTITPGPKYKDLRLDLRKFEAKGNPKWGNVLYLRIVHLGGNAETGILLDDVMLEKE